jgi:hypothetical protein
MSEHPLTAFIYETFGQQFGDLIFAGYGARASGGRRTLHLIESEGGAGAAWVIELVATRPPCGDEPLVLAALIKLLLSRPIIASRLEFETGELLAELQWRDDSSTRRQVEKAIVAYVRLLYDKRADARAGRRTTETEGGGCYHLLTGYFRGDKPATDAVPDRTIRSVYFDAAFVEGLKQGQVCFAGINFGALQTGV